MNKSSIKVPNKRTIRNKINNNKETKTVSNRIEKIILIYVITITLLLVFFSQFFIHNIVDGIMVDNLDKIRVTEDKFNNETDWNELKQLSIFNNKYFNDRAIIAPGVEGVYNFSVENECTCDFYYEIEFIEENPYNVNMVYKLKKNGEYILGNENTWEEPEKLSQSGMRLNQAQKDVYTIEWRWEHTDYDTQIGVIDGAYYKMFADVRAEQILKVTE